MKDITYKRYHGPRRWLSVAVMAAVSAGLVALAGGWYTAARAEHLHPHEPPAVTLAEAVPLRDAALFSRYGVEEAWRAADGAAVVTAVRGYRSTIRVRSVFAADGKTLAAIQVLAQDETEYLGARVETAAFTAQFDGRRAPLKLWGGASLGSPIDALSGATVTSQAAVDAVNRAYAFLCEYDKGK